MWVFGAFILVAAIISFFSGTPPCPPPPPQKTEHLFIYFHKHKKNPWCSRTALPGGQFLRVFLGGTAGRAGPARVQCICDDDRHGLGCAMSLLEGEFFTPLKKNPRQRQSEPCKKKFERRMMYIVCFLFFNF